MEIIMKKVKYLLITVMALSFFSVGSFAQGELKEVLTQAKETKPGKKSRRKKVEMCHECGKPEPQCECEGHGDNKAHDDHDSKDKK
jgi:hypothetical protein